MSDNINATHFIGAFMKSLGGQASSGRAVKPHIQISANSEGHTTIEIIDLNNRAASPFVVFESFSPGGRRWEIAISPSSEAHQMAKALYVRFLRRLEELKDSGEEINLANTSKILLELTRSVSGALF